MNHSWLMQVNFTFFNQAMVTERTAESRLSLKKHIVKEFGQSKGQRMYEQADRMQVSVQYSTPIV